VARVSHDFFDQPATSYGMENSTISLFWNYSISSSFISYFLLCMPSWKSEHWRWHLGSVAAAAAVTWQQQHLLQALYGCLMTKGEKSWIKAWCLWLFCRGWSNNLG
jgi:hypothetical protein